MRNGVARDQSICSVQTPDKGLTNLDIEANPIKLATVGAPLKTISELLVGRAERRGADPVRDANLLSVIPVYKKGVHAGSFVRSSRVANR